jgi:hypothetical protein
MDLESTQPLTEMNTSNLPGAKGRLARKVDNLTAIYEPRKCGSLDVSQSYGRLRRVTEIALRLLYIVVNASCFETDAYERASTDVNALAFPPCRHNVTVT